VWGRFETLIWRLQKYFKKHQHDTDNQNLIVQACRRHLKENHGEEEKDRFLGAIAVAAAWIADKSLFDAAVSEVEYGFSAKAFFKLGKLISFASSVISMKE
jgi:hypothetical protein